MSTKQLFKLKLSSRRALVRALRKKVSPKALAQRFPREAVLSYKAELLAFTRHLRRLVDEELSSKLPALIPKSPTTDTKIHTDASNKDAKRLVAGIKAQIGRNFTQTVSKRAATKAATQIDTINKSQFLKQFKTALNVDVAPAITPKIRNVISEFIAENVALIKSIETRYLADIQATLEESFAKGRHVSSIVDLIKERGDVSDSRADLIARDQVSKLNGQLTQVRQENLGVTKYLWSTSKDERVRSSHQDLDGLSFFWDDPPDTGNGFNHPGEDFQCRCQALPILDDLLDDLPVTEFIGD